MTTEENIEKGQQAMHHVVEKHDNVKNAMYRNDTDSIDFVWGTPGIEPKFKKGYGIAHILAKHVPESGERLLEAIVETIARGNVIERQSKKESTQSRILIGWMGYTALLSLGDETKNTWLLTGWENFDKKCHKKETSNASGEGNGSAAATATTPMRSHRDGEDVSSSALSIS